MRANWPFLCCLPCSRLCCLYRRATAGFRCATRGGPRSTRRFSISATHSSASTTSREVLQCTRNPHPLHGVTSGSGRSLRTSCVSPLDRVLRQTTTGFATRSNTTMAVPLGGLLTGLQHPKPAARRGLPHSCTNSRCGAKYQGAHCQVRNKSDQKVPEEMGTDR